MKKTLQIAFFLVAACAHIHSATAQIDAKNGIKIASNDDARCKKNAAQYTETLQFLRQSAGEQLLRDKKALR